MDSLNLNPHTAPTTGSAMGREDLSEYVAHLQMHMTLQARNLVPSIYAPIDRNADRRNELLQETQASFEKMISRQPRH
jgi:hypothetical protein